MTELNVMALALVVRGIATCLTVAAAAYLAYHGKEGWGWMIFLAICLGSYSYKYTND
jgi:hypothetical protein